MYEMLLDRAGRRRSPATLPDFHAGRPPRNKGLRYPADPAKVEEIVAVMRTAGDDAHGRRLGALIVVLWRAGLRIQEGLALAEVDLDHRRGALLVGLGRTPVMARATCRSARRPFVLCPQRPDAVISGRPPPLEPSCAVQPPPRVSVDDSLHISCATPTPSRWLAKA